MVRAAVKSPTIPTAGAALRAHGFESGSRSGGGVSAFSGSGAYEVCSPRGPGRASPRRPNPARMDGVRCGRSRDCPEILGDLGDRLPGRVRRRYRVSPNLRRVLVGP